MERNETSETARKVLDAAAELFATKGFEATSVRDIAAATGMTMSNIYYYYQSKEGLLVAVLEKFWRHMYEGLHGVIESDLPPLERFRLLVKTHLRLVLEEYRNRAKIAVVEERLRVSKQLHREALDMYRKELENLQSFGYIDKGQNVTLVAFYILGGIIWHLRWYRSSGQFSLDQITENYANFVLGGILTGPASGRGTECGS